MVEIKFNKVFQFKSYNQAPNTFNECRDLFKNIFKKALDKIVGEEEGDSASEDTSSEDEADGSEEDEKEDSVMDQLAAILADKNIEERADFCRENFPKKIAEKLLQKVCGFNEKESKFIIEN